MWVIVPLLLGGYSQNENQEDLAHVAAGLTVVALRASVDFQVASPGRWLLLPEGRTLSESELVDSLVRMDKPLECLAQQSGSQIAVACQPPQDMDTFVGIQTGALESVKRVRDSVPEADLRFLVRGGSQHMIVSESAFALWISTYDVRGAVKRWTVPCAEAERLGAHACLTLKSSSQFRVIVDTSGGAL